MRFKEVKKLIKEDEELFEVKMTGGNLSKLAKQIKDVMIGLEFEMIVPNASADDDDGDIEPDYDQDERVEDIDDCVRFFDDSEGYNSRRMLDRLYDEMETDFQSWRMEQLDNDWYGNDGYEFFMEYLEREDAFDRDYAVDTARDELIDAHPDMDPTSEQFQELLSERVQEMESEFIQTEWEDRGSWHDRAREEYDDDQISNDVYSERDWLRDRGIRTAQDVESEYSFVQWPYYTSSGGGEADVKRVALDFLNDSSLPYKQVAVSTSYHGNYELWNGNDWVQIGRNKPHHCFTIEPDGSLDSDEANDVGLEFVSPPIPLDQIESVMKGVQQWASSYGAYTGLANATSMHTNISIPGYSIENLDYVKAALLLGDEHILREFDRISNNYTKPAIDKVRKLVGEKPERVKELLDKMKSGMNAQASKLLHSGVTDKFTSINTKDNRIEFRSPGGDYLGMIADDPKKLVDTINRMVVVMDAAMDPEKFKEEYQKKLYKALTGDVGSRKGKTGEVSWTISSNATIWDKDTRRQMPAFTTKVEAKTAKEAWEKVKKDLPADATQSEYTITSSKIPTPGDKDMLKVFSRYAAGEMPQSALKSFLKQAQAQRKYDREKIKGKNWWNVKYNGQRIEVVADSEVAAKITAAKEWGLPPTQATYNQMEAEVLRPYDDSPVKAQIGEPQPIGQQSTSSGQRNFQLYNIETNQVIDTFPARNYDEAMTRLRDYRQFGDGRSNPDNFSIRPEPNANSPTAINTPPQSGTGEGLRGNWGFWMTNAGRFANWPGEGNGLRRFSSREVAQQWLDDARAQNPRLRSDIEIREIEPERTPVSDINLFPELEPGQPSSEHNLRPTGPGPWEIYRLSDGSSVRNLEHTHRGAAETEAIIALNQRQEAPQLYGVRTRQPVQTQQQAFTGEWKIVDPDGNELYRFSGIGNNQSDANNVAIRWLRQNPQHLQGGVEVLPVMG